MMQKNQRQFQSNIGSYPHTSIVLSITAANFVIGIFLLLVMHAQELTALVRANLEIHIYLQRNISENDKQHLTNSLSQLKFIDPQSKPKFISKEVAAQELIRQTGEQFIDFLGENPLRDAFVINIKEEFYKTDKLKVIATQLASLQGVFEVNYQESLIDQINANIQQLTLMVSVFILILLLTVVILINSAIKIALFSQRFLIRSMQLVGATAFFIKKPFLLRAATQGFIGALFACSLLLLVLTYSNLQIEELALLQDLGTLILLFILLIIIGIGVSLCSAYLAVSRYLKFSTEEFYE
ncbi:MAG: ABC transporter permease [Bacteroidetes bacterium]|nr:MAG: ABC transporter permease [Bacteroidota bacterium]